MGAALFAEMEDVLGRDSLFTKCPLMQPERDELLDIYLACCRWTQVFYGWRPNLRDEGDNHIIELAVAGAAEAIVTQNIKDFRQAELKFPGLRLFTPTELLKELAG
jgi:predicted nucleic acid-binding protein